MIIQELQGNIWEIPGNNHIVITTNGTVKTNGECVMGRGIAAQAKNFFPEVPKIVGSTLKKAGLIPFYIGKETNPLTNQTVNLWSFPVKYRWYEEADLNLIVKAMKIFVVLMYNSKGKILIPRPGCGNGRLGWVVVKKELEKIPCPKELNDKIYFCSY